MPNDKYKNRIDREYEEANYEARHAFWFNGKWIVAIVLGVLAIGAGIWVLTVVTSDVKGAGDARKTNQSGTNRIAKQEMFEQLYQDIQTADLNVDTMFQMKQADPSYTNKVNYTGAITHCTKLVGDYDAEARKYSSADWKDNALPEKIDRTDPKFDCKENK